MNKPSPQVLLAICDKIKPVVILPAPAPQLNNGIVVQTAGRERFYQAVLGREDVAHNGCRIGRRSPSVPMPCRFENLLSFAVRFVNRRCPVRNLRPAQAGKV